MSDHRDIPRDELEALLVFLANGTLEGDERDAVEAAVADDPQLQAELEALKSIRSEMQADAPAATPGEFGLARLMRDIDRETQDRLSAQAPAETTDRSRIWKFATAAAVALVALQTAVFVTSPESVIELAGGGSEAQTGPTVIVAFNETATEGAIRAALLDLGLVIVDGPSALGLYTLAAPDEATRDAAIDRLSALTGLVDSAETGD